MQWANERPPSSLPFMVRLFFPNNLNQSKSAILLFSEKFSYLICAKIEGNLSANICICFSSTRTSFQSTRKKHVCLIVGKYGMTFFTQIPMLVITVDSRTQMFLCSKRYFSDVRSCMLPIFLRKRGTFQIGNSNIRLPRGKRSLEQAEWWSYKGNLSWSVFNFFMFVCDISIN
jgi:hypothetical protein